MELNDSQNADDSPGFGTPQPRLRRRQARIGTENKKTTLAIVNDVALLAVRLATLLATLQAIAK